MTEHTPGPWMIEQPSGNAGEAEVIGSIDRTVCWTASTWDTAKDEDVVTDEDRANARLIAASPELLAGLKQIAHKQETGEGGFSVAELCHALIAIAEGGK